MNRLHLGCADVQPDGWAHVDALDWGQAHVLDWRDGLPWPDHEFAYAVSNHALSMIAPQSVPFCLAEVRRVLEPGGTFRVLVPDLLAAVHAYERGDRDHFQVTDERENTLAGKLCAYVSQAGSTLSVYVPDHLVGLLLDAKFSEVRHVPPGETRSRWSGIRDLDSRPNESIIVEATK